MKLTLKTAALGLALLGLLTGCGTEEKEPLVGSVPPETGYTRYEPPRTREQQDYTARMRSRWRLMCARARYRTDGRGWVLGRGGTQGRDLTEDARDLMRDAERSLNSMSRTDRDRTDYYGRRE